MKSEQKHLLLKDLCARLPYGVKLKGTTRDFDIDKEMYVDVIVEGVLTAVHSYKTIEVTIGLMNECEIDTVKPYLRPMSSMTKDERLELSRLTNDKFKFYLYSREPEIICYEKYNYLEGLKVLDWLNEHHFDFRNLIGKGLAIDCTDLNIY